MNGYETRLIQISDDAEVARVPPSSRSCCGAPAAVFRSGSGNSAHYL